MTEVPLGVPVLGEVLPWNRARITLLAHFLLALVKVRTVKFAELAGAFAGKAKVESKDKRSQSSGCFLSGSCHGSSREPGRLGSLGG